MPFDRFPCYAVEASLFDKLSETEQTQGILAVFPLPERTLALQASLLLALDGLRDPATWGRLLRTAGAAGVDGVILLPGTVDLLTRRPCALGWDAQFRLALLTTSL
ncbi:MAG: hypothetical protein HC915_07850 [Anaerolineae bacterium]|nr:hypothetical protein [Anaerolineae bacterium]